MHLLCCCVLVLVRGDTAGAGICAGFVGFRGTRATPHTLKVELSHVSSHMFVRPWRSRAVDTDSNAILFVNFLFTHVQQCRRVPCAAHGRELWTTAGQDQ